MYLYNLFMYIGVHVEPDPFKPKNGPSMNLHLMVQSWNCETYC